MSPTAIFPCRTPRLTTAHAQRGGTFLGFILGLVVGLAVALGVAMYVTKVPTPFSNKNQVRTPAQDAAENHKNKEWNPNAALQPRAGAADAAVANTPPAAAQVPPAAPPAATTPVQTAAPPHGKDVAGPDPLGDLAKSKAAPTAASEPFQYWVQVGAYRSQGEADSQKAKMALLGLDAKVTEREQAERTVYRVRLGPFADKPAAERAQAKLDAARVEHTLLRTQR